MSIIGYSKLYDYTVGNGNLLTNGNFEGWVGGTTSAPDGWTLQTGAVAREGTTIKIGTYSAKITHSGTNAEVDQRFHALKGIAYWQGKTVTFGCWIYATVASRGRLILGDGVGNSATSYHTGDSTWQWLSVTRTIDGSATKVGCSLCVDTGNTDVYFDGAVCKEAATLSAQTSLDNWEKTSITIGGLKGNLLTNSNFGTWSAGASAAPDGWTFNADSGASIARESSTIKIGTYSTKLTRVGTDTHFRQDISTEKGITYWQGKTITFGCWVWASVANRACILIQTGVAPAYYSSVVFHTGSSTWEWLSVTFTIPSDAIEARCLCYLENGNTSAYYSGTICLEAATVPQTTDTSYSLTGDQDLEYILEARIVNGYNGGVNGCVRINNDTGSTYGYQGLYGANTTTSASRNALDRMYVTSASALGNLMQFELTIHAKSGYVRTALLDSLDGAATTTVAQVSKQGFSWNNTADEITSLVVLADQTNGLGKGTQITLWGRAVLSNLQINTESTLFTQGTHSLKMQFPTSSTSLYIERTISPVVDLTGVNRYRFDMYSNRTGKSVTIGIKDSGGTWSTVTPTIAVANTWESQEVDISGVATADKDAIDTIRFTAQDNTASTFYIDNMRAGGSPSCSGTAKFGAGSAQFEGFITVADSSDFSFGTGDFTVDFWTRFTDITGIQQFIGQYASATSQWFIIKDAAHKLQMKFVSTTTQADYIMTSAWAPLTGQWYHIELARSSTTTYCFIDGVAQTMTASTAIADHNVGDVAAVLGIGALKEGTYTVKGYMDELRISKGIAKHTANFTPPTTAYTIYGGNFYVVSGLDHLEDRLVSILADGNVVTSQTVTGGTITLTTPTALAHVGLGYNCDLETLNVELGLPDGTLQGRKVQISRVVIRLDNARGGYLGPNFTTMYELLGDYHTGVSTSLFTGDVKQNLGAGYSDGGRFCFRQSDPLPVTILGVIPLTTPGQTTGLS